MPLSIWPTALSIRMITRTAVGGDCFVVRDAVSGSGLSAPPKPFLSLQAAGMGMGCCPPGLSTLASTGSALAGC